MGEEANRPFEVFAQPKSYSTSFRFFRVLMLIYEDVFITDDLFEQIFALISELPADADLERGSFYNSLLEFYIRRRRFAEAEDVEAGGGHGVIRVAAQGAETTRPVASRDARIKPRPPRAIRFPDRAAPAAPRCARPAAPPRAAPGGWPAAWRAATAPPCR